MAEMNDPITSADIINNAIRAGLGVDNIGTWAIDAYNSGISISEIVRAIRYGTDSSEGGQRAHSQYLRAYPQMDFFIKEGIFSGENPEVQYREYRNTVKEAAKSYGIMDALITDEKIASYITGKNSAAEIVQRMGLASQAAATTPPETLKTLNDFYGVQPSEITSFFLDPEITRDVLQTRYAAATIGGEAAKQRFGINRQEAYNLAQSGMTQQQANQAFETATSQLAFTTGPGELTNRDEILASVSGDAAARQKVERIAQSRTGQFQEGGSFATTQRGVVGLGQSTTQ